MSTAKVGDYVRAILVTHVPLFECDADLTREGLVIEIRDGGAELVLETWQGNEFACFAEGAVVVDDATLDEAITDFLFFARLRLGL